MPVRLPMMAPRARASSPVRGRKRKPPFVPPSAPSAPGRHPIREILESSPWILPILLVLLSLGFRWVFVNAGMFHHDEVLLARAVEASAETGRLTGYFTGRYGAVLLNLLAYLPYKAATGLGAERVVPLVAILTGALLAGSMYLFVLEVTDRRLAAALASLFLNFNFLFLTTSTTGKENTSQLFFAVLGLHLLLSGTARGSWPRKTAGAAAFAFSLTVHESGIVLIPIAVLFLLLHGLDRSKGVKELALDAALLLVVTAIPFALYLGDLIVAQITASNPQALPGSTGFAGLFSPILGTAFRDFYAITRAPLLFLAAAGIVALVRKPLLLSPLLLWVLLIFYFGNVSSYGPRYLLVPLVPLVILGGVGGDRIAGHVQSASLRGVAVAGILLLVCGLGIADAYLLIRFRSNYCGPKRMAEFVRERTEPDAIILTMDESVFIEYYAKRKVLTHPVNEEEPNRKFVEEVLALARSGKTVYVNSTAFSYDYQRHFQRLVLENFHVLPVGEVLDEDYHRPEIHLATFPNRLFRIVPK